MCIVKVFMSLWATINNLIFLITTDKISQSVIVRGICYFLLFTAAVCILCFLYIVNIENSVLAPKCIFYTYTGFKCPGCGLQRMMHSLMHGDINIAFRYNYFIPFICITLILAMILLWLKNKGCYVIPKWITKRNIALGHVVLYFTWWLLRNMYDL